VNAMKRITIPSNKQNGEEIIEHCLPWNSAYCCMLPISQSFYFIYFFSDKSNRLQDSHVKNKIKRMGLSGSSQASTKLILLILLLYYLGAISFKIKKINLML